MLLIYIHMVTHKGKEICCGETGRPSAYYGNALACAHILGRQLHICGTDLIYGVFFQPADIYCVIYYLAAALALAGVLTYHRTGGGEGIFLPYFLYRSRIVFCMDK